jgi:lysozyme
MKKLLLIVAAISAALYFIFHKKINLMVGTYWTAVKNLIVKLEGFSPKPYWDYKQWTWGYGTRVPGSSYSESDRPIAETNKVAAIAELVQDLSQRQKELQPLIKPELTSGQWAAFLSFAFNAGTAAAKKLIPLINKGDSAAVVSKMKEYNKVRENGKLVVSAGLVKRREAETASWLS